MASYELTEEADARLEEIYVYSIRKFGLSTAAEYLNGLHATFELLADKPRIGTSAHRIRPGLWRLAHESHVIYYRPLTAGILIVDILHQAQDPSNYLKG